MRRSLIALQALAVVLAAGAAVVPLPATTVERHYADRAYPWLQSRLTGWSNETAFALFDLLIGFAALLGMIAWLRWIGRAFRGRTLWPVMRGAATTLVLGALGYLWFLGAWGLNYARVPLESAIGFDSSRVTSVAVGELAERTLDAVNRTHAAAHAAGFPGPHDRPPALVRALHDVERQMGRPAQ